MESWTRLLRLLAHLNPKSSDFGDICALSSPFLHQLTMPVVVFVVRKLRPCLSYGSCRDHINSVLLRSLDKGGGGIVDNDAILQFTLLENTEAPLTQEPLACGTGASIILYTDPCLAVVCERKGGYTIGRNTQQKDEGNQ